MSVEQRFIQACRKHNPPGRVEDVSGRMLRNGNYQVLPMTAWRYTGVHYTAAWRERSNFDTEVNSWVGHSRHHVNTNGWPGIAYAVGISPSGHILVLREFRRMGFHAFNANANTFGVAMDLGFGQVPTPDALRALSIVLHVLHNDLKSDFPNLGGHANTYEHRKLGFIDARNASTVCAHLLGPKSDEYRQTGKISGVDWPNGEPEKKPDHARIFVPGIGERWVVGNIFTRWSGPEENVRIFGYPLTGMTGNESDGYQQWFERAHMHQIPGAWPDRHDVFLSRLGVDVAENRGYYDVVGKSNHEAFHPAEPLSGDNHRYFEQTRHNVSHGFKAYWDQFGSLDLYGYPISEEFTEDGKTVQYFERARFEWHPGVEPSHHDVLIGRLGAELLAEQEPMPAPPPERRPVSLDSWIPVSQPNDVNVSQIVAVTGHHNRKPKYTTAKIRRIAEAIIQRSDEFGFRTSVCAGQIMHETGFFQFGGQVQPEQNNFAGLGATNNGAAGATFPNEDEGVLAVMCHLALYVYGDIDQWPEHLRKYSGKAIRRDAVRWADQNTTKPDGQLLRYLGTVKVIKDLVNGRWAQTDSVPLGTLENGYARSLVRVANEIIAV